MKKLFLTVLAAVMCMASGANAVLIGSGSIESYNRQYQTEFKRVCEVCPYADDEMCKNWTPDCDDEDENGCTYMSQSACESACAGYQGDTCACFGSGMCWERSINLPKYETNQYLSEILYKTKTPARVHANRTAPPVAGILSPAFARMKRWRRARPTVPENATKR